MAVGDAKGDRCFAIVAAEQERLSLLDGKVGLQVRDPARHDGLLFGVELDRSPHTLKCVALAFGPAERIARETVEMYAVFYKLLLLVADLCTVLGHSQP